MVHDKVHNEPMTMRERLDESRKSKSIKMVEFKLLSTASGRTDRISALWSSIGIGTESESEFEYEFESEFGYEFEYEFECEFESDDRLGIEGDGPFSAFNG